MNINNHNGEKGAVAVVVAVSLLMFLGITAFTVDVGFLQFHKRHLQNTADAAALAGAREYIDGDPSLDNITDVVEEYVELNAVDVGEVISVSQSKVPLNNPTFNTVKVDLKGNRNLFFAGIFGVQNSDIGVTATAIAAPISGFSGLIPFATDESTANKFEDGTEFDLYYKKDDPGNWGTVDFDGGGGGVPELTERTLNGYDDIISRGDIIYTETGAELNSKNFKDAFQTRVSTDENFQYVVIPVIADGKINGTGPVEVKGFIAIEIISGDIQGQDMDVRARYYGTIEIGEIDPGAPNYELQGLRLIE